ncbi:hypothetical protein [Citreicoccus inhibens]|uniref:hypothetical protein n=1 Tax=Citreicoccus inhibens TaxID=2849499 RepID=UPI001F1E2469|nr:hypothetical protein [Citreicoccus inhibens]
MTSRGCWLGMVVLVGAVACSRGSTSEAPVPSTRAAAAEGSEAAGADATGLVEKLKFKDDEDREVLSLKPKPDGAKLIDGEGREVARYKWKGADLEVSGPDDAVLARVSREGDGFVVRDARSGPVRFSLVRDGAGWRLLDGAGAPRYAVVADGSGFRVSEPSGEERLRVHVREGKVSLREPSGRTRFATKSPVRPVAVACLGFESLDLPLRGALLFLLQDPASSR